MMQRRAEERQRERGFERQAEPREVEHERRFAHAEAVDRHRRHLHDERHRNQDREVRERDRDAAAPARWPRRRRRASACTTMAPAKHATSARGAARNRASAAVSRVDALFDPLLMERAERPEQLPDAVRHQQHRRRRRASAAAERQPRAARADRADRCRSAAPRSSRPSAATNTRPSSPMPRSTSTTVVASVFDPARRGVSRMRMTSPPMFDGRKLLKNVATRNELRQRAERRRGRAARRAAGPSAMR